MTVAELPPYMDNYIKARLPIKEAYQSFPPQPEEFFDDFVNITDEFLLQRKFLEGIKEFSDRHVRAVLLRAISDAVYGSNLYYLITRHGQYPFSRDQKLAGGEKDARLTPEGEMQVEKSIQDMLEDLKTEFEYFAREKK